MIPESTGKGPRQLHTSVMCRALTASYAYYAQPLHHSVGELPVHSGRLMCREWQILYLNDEICTASHE